MADEGGTRHSRHAVGRKDVDPAKMLVWGPAGWAVRTSKYLNEDRMAGFESP